MNNKDEIKKDNIDIEAGRDEASSGKAKPDREAYNDTQVVLWGFVTCGILVAIGIFLVAIGTYQSPSNHSKGQSPSNHSKGSYYTFDGGVRFVVSATGTNRIKPLFRDELSDSQKTVNVQLLFPSNPSPTANGRWFCDGSFTSIYDGEISVVESSHTMSGCNYSEMNGVYFVEWGIHSFTLDTNQNIFLYEMDGVTSESVARGTFSECD